jgi:hypothetical protein
MSDQALYVYGITAFPIKIDNLIGIDGKNNIEILELGGFVVVVSNVCLEEFGHPAIDENSENIAWLKEKAEAHMNVLKAVLEHAQVMPLRFCTIFYDTENIVQYINENREYLSEWLNFMDGKEEWSCKLYWNKKQFVENCMKNEKDIASSEVSNASKGAAYFMKKKIDENLSVQAGEKVNRIISKVSETLEELVLELKHNRILAREITGRQEDMLANYSLMIDRSKKDHFLKSMETLKLKVEGKGLILEYNGSWPAYSFLNK